MIKNLLFSLVFWISCVTSIGQNLAFDTLSKYSFPLTRDIDTSYISHYNFIDFSKNNYQFYSANSPNWEKLYERLKGIDTSKTEKLHFYHIGGSHIQADIYSNDMRSYLQTSFAKNGERGMVFPFEMAHTNNPSNYKFTSPNNWVGYRSVVHRDPNIDYGLLGAVVFCDDSVINLQFNHRNAISRPSYTKVRIYHNKGDLPYELNFGNEEILVVKTKHNPQFGYTEIEFTDPIDTMDLQFSRTINERINLEIYGFLFMNNDPGISYTSIGINGAGLYTYLDCVNFQEQLSLYPPDFFAFSVGTNDGNVPYDKFDPQVYKRNLEKMMKIVLKANPECAILLTVPNDSYYQRRYLNKNIAREREVIIELAQQYKMPVWDMYGIMGELGSSKTWQRQGLMRTDLVHFTSEGYHLKGELFIDAFLKFMDQMQLSTLPLE